MMQQIILNKKQEPEQTNQTLFLVGSDAKNALPVKNTIHFNAVDMMGLSWIFAKEDDFDIC